MLETILEYLKLLFSRSWKDTSQTLVARIVFSLAFGAAILAVQSTLSATLSWLQAAVLASTAVFIGLFVVQLLIVSPYRLWKENRDITASLTATVQHLKSRLEPKFEILYEKKEPFEVIKLIGTQHQERTFRIGIKNISGSDVPDVKVELESIAPGYANNRGIILEDMPLTYLGLPIELRQINDEAPYRKQFNLSPDQTQIIEVVSKMEATASSPSTLTMNALMRGIESIDLHIARQQTEFRTGENPVVQNYIYAGRYELTLFVTASNAPARSETFITNIDNRGRLSFERKS